MPWVRATLSGPGNTVADSRGHPPVKPVSTIVAMEWPFDRTGTYLDAHIEFADFTGAQIRESRLNGVRFVGVEMVDAEIDGYVENLVVNGVHVMPLVEAELDRRFPVRMLARSDDPVDLREAWAQLVAAWAATIERARQLTEAQRHEQVRGEWSITQTIRHLIFVVDSWFSRGVNRIPMPYHPAGLPPAFMDGIVEMGIDTTAEPTFDDAVDLWHRRAPVLTEYLASATADDLARICEPNDGPLWPPIAPDTAAVRCLRVVFDETWAHHQFAIRDLAILESSAPAANAGR